MVSMGGMGWMGPWYIFHKYMNCVSGSERIHPHRVECRTPASWLAKGLWEEVVSWELSDFLGTLLREERPGR